MLELPVSMNRLSPAEPSFLKHLGHALRWGMAGALALGGLWLLVVGPRDTESIPEDRVIIN